MLVLGKNRTPYPQPRADSELIQHGIYARVRHPLYTSVMLASLGWAMIWQSAAAFGAALVLIPFFHAKARREERWLGEQFSDDEVDEILREIDTTGKGIIRYEGNILIKKIHPF